MTYTAVTGQSLYDICLITYGSFDFLLKLANDNGITDLNNTALTGIAFSYDSSLVANQAVNQALNQQINQKYGTAFIQNTGTDGGGVYGDAYGGAYG